MSMLIGAFGRGLQGASSAAMNEIHQPGPASIANTIQVQAPQQVQAAQPARQQNLSDAVQNLNVADHLAQQVQNKSIADTLNKQTTDAPFRAELGNGSNVWQAQQGDAAAMAGRAAHTAGQFAGPGNAAQAGEAAGQAAHAASIAPNSLGVSAQQLANTQSVVQQDTRDEQAAQERGQLGINPQQQQQMNSTADEVNTGAYTPANLYQSSLAFR